MGSTRYENWITSIPFAWMGPIARRLWGGLARVVGDWAIDWLKAALDQQHPNTADEEALPLIGSGRRRYRGRNESVAAFRERLPRSFAEWERAGTALGLLWEMHLEGWTGAVIVQQNGRGFHFDGPIDPNDPRSALVITELGGNPAVGGHPWWTFDNNVEYCSRFAILFPNGAGAFTRIGYAVFDGSEDGSAVATFPTPFDDTSYLTMHGMPISDEPAIVSVTTVGKTAASVRVLAPAGWVGKVPVLAWPVGEHPFANMAASDLSRLRRVVNDWRPAKARCMGVYVVISGELWDWPVGTWDEPGGIWGPPGEVIVFQIHEE